MIKNLAASPTERFHERDRNAKNFESANDIATAVEIPANNAISKDRKRRVSQTAAMFSNCGGNAAEDEPRKLAYIPRRFIWFS